MAKIKISGGKLPSPDKKPGQEYEEMSEPNLDYFFDTALEKLTIQESQNEQRQAAVKQKLFAPDGQEIDAPTHNTMFAFLRLKLEEKCVFYAQAHDGVYYIQRLRSMLSRLRTAARQQGIEPGVFKMLVESIETITIEDELGNYLAYDKVTLLKTRSPAQRQRVEVTRAITELGKELD